MYHTSRYRLTKVHIIDSKDYKRMPELIDWSPHSEWNVVDSRQRQKAF